MKHQTYWYEVHLANLHPEHKIRQEVVNRLIKIFFDPNSDLDGQACTWLLSFREKDFADSAKMAIRKEMAAKKLGKGIVLVCGVANIQDQLPCLKELLIDEVVYSKDPNKRYFPKWYFTLGWSARLALARMGVQEDIEKCLTMVDTVTDAHTKATILFHDVAYIRRPEAMEYLRKNFLSDARLSPTNPGVLGEPVSNYLMSVLADCLSNFPVKRKEARNYTKEEVDLCRKWMSEQTKWDIIR